MEHLHQEFLKTLNRIIEENPQKEEEIDIERLISNVTPEAVRSMKLTFIESSEKMLKDRRKLNNLYGHLVASTFLFRIEGVQYAVSA